MRVGSLSARVEKRNRPLFIAVGALLAAALASGATGAAGRARDLGIPFGGTPGKLNAITDVGGVTVGYTTRIEDLAEGKAVRTGVTAILPRGRDSIDKPAFAGIFSLNGNGEMTGAHWVKESGFLEGPVLLTNTHSVGVVRDAAIAWRVRQGKPDASGYWWSLPVVAETWDGELNDINGFHVGAMDVDHAIESASGGAIAEGNVGGGTGMTCHEFKCGTGTASRIARLDAGDSYTVGVLVQANYGLRSELRVAGVPVGQELPAPEAPKKADSGSIIIVVATDAPLLPHQLERLAKRATMGLARNGSYAGNGSGDIFIAFSTANAQASQARASEGLQMLGNDQLDPLFLATADATEEAIINALVAANGMSGTDGSHVEAIDHAALRAILRRHGRLR
jgi:D-aminopeptidase